MIFGNFGKYHSLLLLQFKTFGRVQISYYQLSNVLASLNTHFIYNDIVHVIKSTWCSSRSRISHRGGHRPRGGGANSRGGYVSKYLYVKTKESGPVGGHVPVAPPGSTTVVSKVLNTRIVSTGLFNHW